MSETGKKQRKGSFTESELVKIDCAMGEEGFRNFSEYVMHMVNARQDIGDAEQRRRQMVHYRYAHLLSIYNQMNMGIDVLENLGKFMEEARKLCQELK